MITFYKDKKNKFKCSIQIDGASKINSFARLCLESKDGFNYFFNGTINEDGTCIINMPSFNGVELNEGTAKVEVVADSQYFPVYETQFKVTKAVQVKIEIEEELKENEKPTISFELDEEAVDVPEEIEKVIKEVKKKSKVDFDFNNFLEKYKGAN